MTPIQVLKHEHQIILKFLDAVEYEIQQTQAGEAVHVERFEQMIDFIQNFADRSHHAKEETLLFTRMQDRGMPIHGGPISVMLLEHEKGRRLVQKAAEALPPAARGESAEIKILVSNLSEYVNLLRAHIHKEDHILYPMADQILTVDDQTELAAAFGRVEAEEIREGTHERYHLIATEYTQ